jgi:hypothetical protein
MLSDLTHIPRIMRRQGWLNGARLLDQWFSRSRAVAPAYSSSDTTTIRMDAWVLTFPRAREVYDRLVRERIWSNPAARPVVTAMLRRKGLLGVSPRSFGRLTDPVPSQDPDYVNQRPAGGYTHFDDMAAALGNFNLRVVVAGTVAPVGPGLFGHQVQITEVGVYVRDSFDFEGDQYLGCWSDDPDGFFPFMPPDPGAGMGFSFQPPLFSPVGNRDFRAWRDRTGRGGDFLVFSDLKRVPVNPPDTFVVL